MQLRTFTVLSVAAALGATSPAAAQDPGAGGDDGAGLRQIAKAYVCDDGIDSRHGGDLAFWENRAVVACGADNGDVLDDGFALLDIQRPSEPRVLSTYRCAGSASDVAIWGDLVFLAADTNNDTQPTPQPAQRPYEFDGVVAGTGSGPCREEAATDDPLGPPPAYFRGVRIISVANPRKPRHLASIATGGLGAHNLSVVPDVPGRVLVFAADPGGPTKVLAVPTAAPEQTDLHDWEELPPGSDQPQPLSGCHDISFFLPRKLATCHRNYFGTVLVDLSGSLLTPRRLSFIANTASGGTGNPQHFSHHSSAFAWDGNRLVLTDEHLAEPAVCTPLGPGAISVYDISRPEAPALVGRHDSPTVAGYGFCTSKQVSVVPLRSGRDVAVVSWYAGGTSMIDFTSEVRELARFAGPPASEERSFAWASYWYRDNVYVNNAWGCIYGAVCLGTRTRGLEVLETAFQDPSLAVEFEDVVRQRHFNFGTQECLGSAALGC